MNYGYVREPKPTADPFLLDRYFRAIVLGGQQPESSSFDTLAEAKAFVEERVG